MRSLVHGAVLGQRDTGAEEMEHVVSVRLLGSQGSTEQVWRMILIADPPLVYIKTSRQPLRRLMFFSAPVMTEVPPNRLFEQLVGDFIFVEKVS